MGGGWWVVGGGTSAQGWQVKMAELAEEVEELEGAAPSGTAHSDTAAHGGSAGAAGGEEDRELETCCICLDSLSQAPVVALLHGGGGGRRSCPHFIHESCAARLSPQLCPMCRTPFDACSAPFGGGRITELGAKRVIAGTMRLLGQPAGETAPTSAVVPLLAAIFPVRLAALEVAVGELAVANSPRSASLLKSTDSGSREIGAEGLSRVLERCDVMLSIHEAPPPAAAAAPALQRLQTYTRESTVCPSILTTRSSSDRRCQQSRRGWRGGRGGWR